MSGTSIDSSIMVSISAVSAVRDSVDSGFLDVTKDIDLSDTSSSSSFAPLTTSQDTADNSSSSTSSTSSTTAATSSEPQRVAVSEEPKKNDIAAPLSELPIILLPPVEIESRATNNNNTNDHDDGGVSESTDPLPTKNAQLPKQATKAKTIGATSANPKIAPKPAAAAGTKKPLSASTGKATGTTTALGSVGRTKSATSSLTKTSLASSASTKQRPPIPDSLKRSASSSTATATAPSIASRSTTITSSSKSLSPSSTSQLRKSPSTPSLAGSTVPIGASRNSTSTGRRVASSSGADIGSSPRSSPSGTPGPTRSPSQASITPPTASTTKRPAAVTSLSSSSIGNRSSTPTTSAPAAAAASHCRRTGASLAPNPLARQVGPSSAFSKPVPKPVLVVPTPPPAPVRRTSAVSTTTSTTRSTTAATTRPVSDAVKVKMLNTQLSGLQEKHEQTLKLLQEQEERMKRELEELSVVPELQRKPISSDVQDVLKEMEELRKQFNDAKAQHEKALEDLAAERALEVSQLKEAHEALLSTLTKEKDTLTESLEVLQETSELTVQEKDERIKELEEKIESSLQRHADAVSKHAEALESLRVEIEASLTKKHEAAVLELTRVHEERIKVLEEKASGSVKEAELQKLKDSMDEQIKELEDEQESRILELIAMHELDIQDLKDNLRNQADAHEELVAHMKQEHAEEIDRLLSEVKTAQSTKAELNQVRTELDDARKQLVSKDTELAELMKRIAELTKDLENASMSTLLKNTEKYKIKRVQIYGSSVSGNHKIKRAQQSISDTLERNEIEYEFVDISVSEDDKRYMRRKNGGELQLPQIFSDGEYRGVFEDFEYALETHQLLQFLAFDRVKPFVPRQKIGFGAIREGYAQDGEDAEQGAGLPTLVVNGMNDRPATTMGVLRPRRNTDMGTSKYLLSPGSKQFLPRSNGRSRGFVQAASQAWEGALREDITQVKHDLGIGAVIPDDDELDELFENGEVSEADLEAMVNSF